MGFSDKQLRSLRQAVAERNVRTRRLNGREFPYIEGWVAICEANRIFGFEGWDRETQDIRCIVNRDFRGTCLAIYSAKVRITVRADGAVVVREGHGTGEGRSASTGEAHEVALKAAETDATKRALCTFGKPFGLELYRGRTAPKKDRPADALQIEESDGSESTLVSDSEPVEAANVILAEAAATDQSASTGAPDVVSGPTAASITKAAQALAQPTEATAIAASAFDARFDLTAVMTGRRVRDRDHRRFVASQPCLICGGGPCDAHHVSFAQPRALGRKVGDQFTVPLCRMHHQLLHENSNEAAWWHDLDIDAIALAEGLWEETRSKRAELIRSMPGAIDPVAASTDR